MKNKQPPFEITHQIIDSMAQIAELVEETGDSAPGWWA